MPLWEKTLINLQKGVEKLNSFSAVFAERMRAEINIVRLRMQLDDVQGQIDEQHRIIGKKLAALHESGSLPESFENFFTNDDIADALANIARLEKQLDNIHDELAAEAESIKSARRYDREKSA